MAGGASVPATASNTVPNTPARPNPQGIPIDEENDAGAGYLRPRRMLGRVRALLRDGPLQGREIEVEPVEGRPPKTIDVPNEDGGASRYCLEEWVQEGMTAAYTFLYAV